MSQVVIYHNPRCSKSRQTLALLEERGISPEVRLYLQQAPEAAEVEQLLTALGISAHQLLRTKEAEYKEHQLSPESSHEQIVTAITQSPKLLERPVVLVDGKARIGRPPESVLEIL